VWVLEHSGFSDIRWGKQVDVFSGSKHESSAASFGTRGLTIAATKARDRERVRVRQGSRLTTLMWCERADADLRQAASAKGEESHRRRAEKVLLKDVAGVCSDQEARTGANFQLHRDGARNAIEKAGCRCCDEACRAPQGKNIELRQASAEGLPY
jgi:hypothetical protein